MEVGSQVKKLRVPFEPSGRTLMSLKPILIKWPAVTLAQDGPGWYKMKVDPFQ